MKARLIGLFAALLFSMTLCSAAQAPAVPSGSTGVCNDGTYTTAASKRGACAGHKGLKTWLAASAPAASNPAATQPSPASSAVTPPTPMPTSSSAPVRTTPASGGSPGQVWVNTKTNVYHCQGDRNYATTRAGQYMSEADAKAKGARAAYNKPCSK